MAVPFTPYSPDEALGQQLSFTKKTTMESTKTSINKCLLILIISVMCINLSGQSVCKDYTTKSIYLKGNNYIKNGKLYPNGFLLKKLKRELDVSPEAKIEFKKYKKNRNLGITLSSLGAVSVITGFIPFHNGNLRQGLIIGGLGLFLISLPFDKISKNNLNKAIWLRNGVF